MRQAAAMPHRRLRWAGAGRRTSFLLGGVLAVCAGALAAATSVLGQVGEPPRQDVSPAPAPRQPLRPTLQQVERFKLNQDALILDAGRPGTTYQAMANDLIAAVDAGAHMRVLPVEGDGGPANLQDALYLRGIDMAIVPANVLAHAKASNAFGGNLAQRLAYVTVLYSEEVHIVAGAGIAAVGDLRGKRVAVPADDGTAQFTSGDILRRFGVPVERVPMTPADALEEVRTGSVAAAILMGGKPLGLVAALPKDGSVRLLSLPFPVLPSEAYAPAVLLPEDYPALIPPGTIVETVAVNAVLMAGRGEDAAHRVTKHTPAVLEAIARLAISERHPKWRDVNLGAALPGWPRVEAAEIWLRQASAQRKEALQGNKEQPPRSNNRIKSSELATDRRKKLIDEFDAWARMTAARDDAVK
ncbi:MAG: hypothetical protein J2P50_08150 [Hyphomicrobiaceae bacterium]|nr:hypothetical protein [Hyphomicrobiaceae bacterium]